MRCATPNFPPTANRYAIRNDQNNGMWQCQGWFGQCRMPATGTVDSVSSPVALGTGGTRPKRAGWLGATRRTRERSTGEHSFQQLRP